MEDEELAEVEESEFDGSLGMDDQDPYDDPSGYLIDDLGDDDTDFEDDDFDFYDEGDFEEG